MAWLQTLRARWLQALCAQVGGGPSRYRTYHQLHIVERGLRRMAPPGGKSDGGMADPSELEGPLLSWALPAVLQLTMCQHAIWDPPVRPLTACDNCAYRTPAILSLPAVLHDVWQSGACSLNE